MITFQPVFDRLMLLLRNAVVMIPNLLVAIILFAIFVFVSGLVRRWGEAVARRAGLEQGGSLVMGRMARFFALLAGLLLSLSVLFPDFGAGDAINLLGISSVAVGFAFRDILQNFLAGIIILITHPFRVGDQIIVTKDRIDYEGTVEEIQTRATYIKTYDGRRVVIPNADLLIYSVIVNTAFPIRRTEVEILIDYRDDIDAIQHLMIEAMLGLPNVLPQPAPDAPVVSIKGSGVTLRARWWTASVRNEVVNMQDAVLTSIKKKLFDEVGISLPYETREVLLYDATEKTNGSKPIDTD